MRNTEKQFVVAQLERKRVVVDQLQQQLNSYRCVPNTVDLFEKKEDLQSGLNKLATNTENLLTMLKEQGIQVMKYIDNVQQQFEEYNELHHEVKEYVKVARVY